MISGIISIIVIMGGWICLIFGEGAQTWLSGLGLILIGGFIYMVDAIISNKK